MGIDWFLLFVVLCEKYCYEKTTITILLFFCGDSFSTNENQSTSKIPLYKIIKKFTPSLSQTSIINLVEVLY